MSTFTVSDMTCGHCEKTIKAELQKAKADVKLDIDLKNKKITVENMCDEHVEAVLKEIGYTPEKVK